MPRGMIKVVDGGTEITKKSVCRIFQNKDFTYIPDTVDFVEQYKDEYSFPEIKSEKNVENFFKNQKALFSIEFLRLKEANRLAEQGKNVIMNGFALSTLAASYELEMSQLLIGAFQTAGNSYKEIARDAQKLGLHMPDSYVILERSPSKSKKMGYQEIFYQKFATSKVNKASVIEIKNDENEMDER